MIILDFKFLNNYRFSDNYGRRQNVRNSPPRRFPPPLDPPLRRSRFHPCSSHLLAIVRVFVKHARNHGWRKSGKRSFFGCLLRNRAYYFPRHFELLHHLRDKRSKNDETVLRARSEIQSRGEHAEFGEYR